MKVKSRLKLFFFLAFCFVILGLCFFDLKRVSGISMLPSIRDGEFILISRFAYGMGLPFSQEAFVFWNAPKEGDIVMYKIQDRFVIKRLVLCSGARLNYIEKNGEKYLNLDKFSLKLDAESFRNIFADGANETVPDQFFLALGDNLAFSEDSRQYGFVSNKSILGKVLCK